MACFKVAIAISIYQIIWNSLFRGNDDHIGLSIYLIFLNGRFFIGRNNYTRLEKFIFDRRQWRFLHYYRRIFGVLPGLLDAVVRGVNQR